MGDGADTAPGVPLSDMIETLRQELQLSLERGSAHKVNFDVEKVELELKVAVSRKTRAEGGVAFWVLKLGAGGESQKDVAHTFKLTLKPTWVESGKALTISAVPDSRDAPGPR